MFNKSMNDEKVDKLSIHQFYNLEPPFFEEFIIDFKNKIAYWDLNPDFFLNINEYKRIYNKSNNISFDVFEKLYSNVSFDTYRLTEDKIDEFFKKIDFIDSFPIYSEEKKHLKHVSLSEFFDIQFTFYYAQGKKREYIIEDKFPKNWGYFGELIENLVGLDVLNVKYLTANLYQEVKESDELNISKMRFKHQYPHMFDDGDEVDMLFDFKEKTMNGVFNYNGYRQNLNLELSNEKLFYIYQSIQSNKIINWNDKNFQKGAYNHNLIIYDGYMWRLDLQFDNGSVLSFSGSNEHPDTYPFFALEILNITGYDIFRLDKIYYDQLKLYEKYAMEHLID